MKALRYLMLLWQIGRQMGWPYILFRAGFWLQAKTGLLKLRFPKRATRHSFISIHEWRNHKVRFLFDREKLAMQKNENLKDLRWRVRQIKKGWFRYFSKQWFEVPDWQTNPLTGFVYPRNQHWSDVNDFSPKAGDIKYVWEKSRFCFLYDLIRYDYHFDEDQSELVLGLITHWIDNNPVNCGPNWKCSQEISLRILNWTFALHYYRQSPTLNQRLLDKILCSIYDQMRHVVSNIRFSQVALKNNHLLTEALGLYTVGLLMPFLPRATQWRNKGKFIFETEVCEQIARDGTFLQFSMNYHRVVVQLLTWGVKLSELNEDWFCEMVYDRMKSSLEFLRACMDGLSGWLPNYGNNDGALFFPLSESHFRDFRPQLNSLALILYPEKDSDNIFNEEAEWLVPEQSDDVWEELVRITDGTFEFPDGGYFIIRDSGTLTFLRCGKYDSRPFQADNNHLDIWINGRNILRDAGTWLYNADEESMRYFSGTRGHNTIMIGDFDQMQKRHRFIWTHWITNAKGQVGSSGNEYWIEAGFEGFRYLGKGIVHKRRVVKKVSQLHWVIEDYVQNVPKGAPIRQLWHPDAAFDNDFTITATDEHGNEIPLIIESGWYSKMYGEREECNVLAFETLGHYLRTVIEGH